MKDFLPNDYKLPKTGGNYTKLQDGQNKLRIMSAPIMGYEYWTADKKPIRSKTLWDVVPANADLRNGWKPKHFWALVVYNLGEKTLQIFEITQITIQQQLLDLIANEDWGDPREYTITITRKGKDLETEYSVVPSPKKPVPQDITDAYKAKNINLEALFDGKDPFSSEERGVIDGDFVPKSKEEEERFEKKSFKATDLDDHTFEEIGEEGDGDGTRF